MKAAPKTAAATVKHRGITVSIYGPLADRKKEIYLLAYYLGSKRQKQTAKGSLEDAKRTAKEICNRIGAGDIIDGLHLTALDRRVYITAKLAVAPLGRAVDQVCREAAEAAKLLRPGVTLGDAARFWAKHHSGELPEATPAQVIEELYAHLRAKKRSSTTIRTLKPIYTQFGEAFQLPISHVTTDDLDRWLHAFVGHSSRTQLNYRNALVRLFNFAKGKYLPLETPTVAERLESPSQEARGAVEIFKPWELARLLALAPDKLKPCIALGAFAGLRTIELVRLEWSAVHFPDEPAATAIKTESASKNSFPHGFIVVDKAAAKQHRTAARRIIPMQANLLALLEPYRFCTGRISPRSSDAKLSAMITQAIDRINVEEKKAGRPLIGRPKNGLRHSYGTYRFPLLNDAAAQAIEMNNSPREIIEHYRELAMPRDVDAYWQIAPVEAAPIIQTELFA